MLTDLAIATSSTTTRQVSPKPYSFMSFSASGETSGNITSAVVTWLDRYGQTISTESVPEFQLVFVRGENSAWTFTNGIAAPVTIDVVIRGHSDMHPVYSPEALVTAAATVAAGTWYSATLPQATDYVFISCPAASKFGFDSTANYTYWYGGSEPLELGCRRKTTMYWQTTTGTANVYITGERAR